MKADPAMKKAALNLAMLQHDENASPEGKAVGAFCREIILPLMTARGNSREYKQARESLIARGRNAARQ